MRLRGGGGGRSKLPPWSVEADEGLSWLSSCDMGMGAFRRHSLQYVSVSTLKPFTVSTKKATLFPLQGSSEKLK